LDAEAITIVGTSKLGEAPLNAACPSVVGVALVPL
jgi:hypothetical protein